MRTQTSCASFWGAPSPGARSSCSGHPGRPRREVCTPGQIASARLQWLGLGICRATPRNVGIGDGGDIDGKTSGRSTVRKTISWTLLKLNPHLNNACRTQHPVKTSTMATAAKSRCHGARRTWPNHPPLADQARVLATVKAFEEMHEMLGGLDNHWGVRRLLASLGDARLPTSTLGKYGS